MLLAEKSIWAYITVNVAAMAVLERPPLPVRGWTLEWPRLLLQYHPTTTVPWVVGMLRDFSPYVELMRIFNGFRGYDDNC
ncbi:unnamed protein product [Cuscuta campestris]|uniref:Uncharacterized protein n=1 Tax=Cuscuta campestris TaxID=132261 RepID=A0A484KLY6_9ASTE|nr:unnamed protein product [Cuscuta campestris]